MLDPLYIHVYGSAHEPLLFIRYSKTCLKWPLKNIQNKGLNGKMVA